MFPNEFMSLKKCYIRRCDDCGITCESEFERFSFFEIVSKAINKVSSY